MNGREQLLLYGGSLLCVLVAVGIALALMFRKRFARTDMRLPATEPEDWRDLIPEGWRLPVEVDGPEEESYRYVYAGGPRKARPPRFPMLVQREDPATRSRFERLKRALAGADSQRLANRFKKP